MLPDRVSNPEPLTYESRALPIALRGPACSDIKHVVMKRRICVWHQDSTIMYTRIHVHALIRMRRCILAVSRQNLSLE